MSMKKVTLVLMTIAILFTATSYAQTPQKLMHEFYQIADAKPFDAKKLRTFFDDNFVDHDSHDPSKPNSADDVVALFGMLAAAAPDSRHDLTFIKSVDGNKALVRWKFVGTQTAPLFGAPASNKRFDIAGMELWEFKNGKISGLWHVEELMKLFEQISVN